MVQGEKISYMMSTNNSSNGTYDTKKSYDMTKEKTKIDSWSSTKSSSMNGSQQQKDQAKNQYGSWGPVYKNKSNFSEMHFC